VSARDTGRVSCNPNRKSRRFPSQFHEEFKQVSRSGKKTLTREVPGRGPSRKTSPGPLHPDYPDWEKELKRLRRNGIKGLKFHPEFQGFWMHDPKLLPIMEEAQRDFMFMLHVGDRAGGIRDNALPEGKTNRKDHPCGDDPVMSDRWQETPSGDGLDDTLLEHAFGFGLHDEDLSDPALRIHE
jgi:hypothetical protein